MALKHVRVTWRFTHGGLRIRFIGWTFHTNGPLEYFMDTGLLAQELTVDQVWGRAVGAEGGDSVREVTRWASSKSTGADVGDRNAGAIFTLELKFKVAGGGDGGRE